MTRLDREDRASGGQVVRVGDVLSSTKVGADTDTLKEVGSGEERLYIGVPELISTLLRRSDLGSWTLSVFVEKLTCTQLTGESSGQEVDVGGLILGDLLEVVDKVGTETSLLEVLVGELGEGLTVEGSLKVLKGQSVVEDDTVVDTSWWCCRTAGDERRCDSRGCERGDDNGLHYYYVDLVKRVFERVTR